MNDRFRFILLSFLVVLLVSMTACSSVNTDSQKETNSESSKTETSSTEKQSATPAIHSTDNVMSPYFDLTLFNEENYSEVFLGKKFRLEATYGGQSFLVPTKISDMTESGWTLVSEQDPGSTVKSLESVDLVFQNAAGKKISAVLYNSGEKLEIMRNCNIVKFHFENDFYKDRANYTPFQINGVNNGMAITDIIETLGTPSHFYRTAADNYYLDYSISNADRRNGIRVYINPQEDTITAIEIADYQ